MNGSWSQLDLRGHRADVYQPPAPPRFGVLYLHGVGLETLVDRPAFTRLFDELGLACVCPHGGVCWWTDRILPEFDPAQSAERYLRSTAVPFFTERWGLAPRAVGLLGISMGGQGALRLAFKYAREFPVVAALSPAIEYQQWYGRRTPLDEMYDSGEQCRQDTALLHVHPTQYPPHIFFCIDPDDVEWFRGCDRLHEKLSALGIGHTCDLATRAGGHSWDYFNHMADRAVRFVAAGLEQESRRLL
jgi:S-formylglutathione hydrolase